MVKACAIITIILAAVEARSIAALNGESGLNSRSLILDQANKDAEFLQMLPEQARELLLPRLEKHMAGLNSRKHDAIVNTHQYQQSKARRRRSKNRRQIQQAEGQQRSQQQHTKLGDSQLSEDDQSATHSTQVEDALVDIKSFSEQTHGVGLNDGHQPPSYLTLALRKPGAEPCNCETIKRAINTSPEKCIDFCVWKVLRREERRRIDAVMRAEGKGGWANGLGAGLRGEVDKDSG